MNVIRSMTAGFYRSRPPVDQAATVTGLDARGKAWFRRSTRPLQQPRRYARALLLAAGSATITLKSATGFKPHSFFLIVCSGGCSHVLLARRTRRRHPFRNDD